MYLFTIFTFAAVFASAFAVPLDKLPTAPVPNPEEYGAYFEGDLKLTPDQLNGAMNGLLDPHYRWENAVVPYTIASNMPADKLDKITAGLEEIAAKTCVKFVPRTTQPDYVDITNDNTGCWSYMGCIRGRQVVNLQANAGCATKGVAMHEMLHALGFFHSQSDVARDDYVRINFDNILPGKESNFIAYTNSYVSDFGQGYDYESILHYGAFAFTKNGGRTIEPKDASAIIGQRVYLSEKDIKKVNIMYNCAAFL